MNRLFEIKDQNMTSMYVDLAQISVIIRPNVFAVNANPAAIQGAVLFSAPGLKLDLPVPMCDKLLIAWKEYTNDAFIEKVAES